MTTPYGTGAASFEASGGEEGISALVDAFYDVMDSAPRARVIRAMHAHAHLDIGEDERDAWLHCMQRAVDEQPWADDFKAYFMRAIAVPAERVRVASQRSRT